MKKTIYFAGGCFWGTQKFFDQFEGVLETAVGYANGEKANPTYEEVCNDSGHAETVKVVYDETQISLKELLEYYFLIIDPTSVNKQGEDEGIQYRTGIYFEDEADLPVIREYADGVQKKLPAPLVVEIGKLESFYLAEEYHQKYLVKNPTGYCHINPRLFSLRKK